MQKKPLQGVHPKRHTETFPSNKELKNSHSTQGFNEMVYVQSGARQVRQSIPIAATAAQLFTPAYVPPTPVKKKAKKLKSISLLNGGILEYVENNKSPRLTNT